MSDPALASCSDLPSKGDALFADLDVEMSSLAEGLADINSEIINLNNPNVYNKLLIFI